MDVGRRLDKADRTGLALVAEQLRRLGHLSHATDMFRKLGEERAIVQLHVEANNWKEAFMLAERHPEFRHLVYVPYAQWLAENDRFADAQKAFHKAGRPEEAFRVLHQLTENAVHESRFQDAGFYYWVLSRQCLDIARQREDIREEMLNKFQEHSSYASVYYAYHTIQRYLDEPFTSYMPEALFNIALFLMLEMKQVQPKGVSQFAVLYTLSKQARALGAYKLARQVLDKMQTLRVPSRFQEYVNVSALMVRSKPFHDAEELQPMCYRCSSYNPLLVGRSGNRCSNCGQPFIHSFVSFEVLPLVEFELESGISDDEAVRLIEAPVEFALDGKQWTSSSTNDYQTLQLEHDEAKPDPFTARLVNFEVSCIGMHNYQFSLMHILFFDVPIVNYSFCLSVF